MKNKGDSCTMAIANEGHMGVGFSHIPGVKLVRDLIPYEIDTQGNTEYYRFTSGKITTIKGKVIQTKDIIFRKTTDGSITRHEKAYDMWDNRASATYVPINDPFDATGATTYQ